MESRQTHRRLDAYLPSDHLDISIEETASLVHWDVLDVKETTVGRLSFALKDELYQNTSVLTHIKMKIKNKGYGSKVLRQLYDTHMKGKYVRIRTLHLQPPLSTNGSDSFRM